MENENDQSKLFPFSITEAFPKPIFVGRSFVPFVHIHHALLFHRALLPLLQLPTTADQQPQPDLPSTRALCIGGPLCVRWTFATGRCFAVHGGVLGMCDDVMVLMESNGWNGKT